MFVLVPVPDGSAGLEGDDLGCLGDWVEEEPKPSAAANKNLDFAILH
jgi:hypothetical protein